MTETSAGFGSHLISSLGRLAEGRRLWMSTFVVVLVALAIRLPGLSERSLWLDEAYSAWFSALPLDTLWTDAPRYETHPPLYYTLLKGWSALFGTSEAALRGLSTLAGVATILLISLSGRLLHLGRMADRVALLAALLVAINPTSMVFALEARPYALQTLVAAGMVLAALNLFDTSATARVGHVLRACLPSALVLGVMAGTTLWLHNTGVFICFGVWTGLGLALIAHPRARRPASFAAAIMAGLIALAIWSPFLPDFIAQSRSVAATAFWVKAETRDLWSAWLLVTGGPLLLAPVLIAAVMGLVAVARSSRAPTLLVACILVLPLAAVLAVHFTIRPVYVDRLFVWMTPLVLALAAIGLLHGPGSMIMRLALAVLIGGLSFAQAPKWPSNEDWRGMVTAIAEAARPGDRVIALPSEIDPAISYYARRGKGFPETIFVPGPFPFQAPDRVYVGNLGAPRVEEADIVRLEPILAKAGRIWLVSRRADLYDPGNIVRHAVEKDRRSVSRVRAGPITIELFE